VVGQASGPPGQQEAGCAGVRGHDHDGHGGGTAGRVDDQAPEGRQASSGQFDERGVERHHGAGGVDGVTGCR
jgi:hypothetical protein